MKESLKDLLSMLLICILGITSFIWLLLVNFDVPMAAPCSHYLKFSEENSLLIDEFIIKDGVLIEYQGTSQEVIVPKGIIEIGSYAFSNCDNLIKIRLQEGIVKIDSLAFYKCSHLTNVELPVSLNEIDRQAFYGCDQLNFSSLVLQEHENLAYKDLSFVNDSNTANRILLQCAYWKHCFLTFLQSVMEKFIVLSKAM